MNNAYLERAKAEVDQAKKRLSGFAGECAACRWSRRASFLDDDMICEHPAVVCVVFNAADSYAKKRLQNCNEQRDSDSVWGSVVCGPDGALFEKKEPSLWSRIFGCVTPSDGNAP